MSIILGVYTPQIIDGSMSVNYSGGDTPKIIDGCMSVNSSGGVDPEKN